MNELQYKYPDAIVSTDWLAANINTPDLRIFDCTTYLDYNPKSDQPYDVTNGRVDYEQSHIPGASLLDIQGDLSDNENPYLFAIPSVENLAAAFEQQGIGDDTRVILYARENVTSFWSFPTMVGS